MYFDNGCRVCRTGAFLASKSGFSEEETLNPVQDMEEAVACDMEKARYCNEMAVYDPSTRETRYGVKGIAWVLEDKFGKIARVLSLQPLYSLINFFYHIFSYNRRMIAPVYTKVDNDCQPEFTWTFRLVYIAFAALISIGVSSYVPIYTTYVYLLLVGTGWLLHALLIFVYGVKNKMEYFGHLATIMLSGILLQVPFLLGYYLFDLPIIVVWCALLLSDILMTWMSYRRVKYLGLSQRITAAWWLTLHLSAGFIYLLCR